METYKVHGLSGADRNNNLSASQCQTRSQLDPRPPIPLLEASVKTSADILQSLYTLRGRLGIVREKLCGGWPENIAGESQCQASGLLGALASVHGEQYAVIGEIARHLDAIEGSL